MDRERITLSQAYVLKHISSRLDEIRERLTKVDNGLYNKNDGDIIEDMHGLWWEIRQASLEIDELADAIRP